MIMYLRPQEKPVTCELEGAGMLVFLAGDTDCLVVFCSTGFFLFLVLFFCVFVRVAVDGVTGSFTGLFDWFDDLIITKHPHVKKNNLFQWNYTCTQRPRG